MKDLQFHEAANIYPFMDEDAFERLIEDIREHGQRETIKLYEGKILDGRNRYKACLHCNVAPKIEHVTPKDPVAFMTKQVAESRSAIKKKPK